MRRSIVEAEFNRTVVAGHYGADREYMVERAENNLRWCTRRAGTARVVEYWYDDIDEIINAKVPECNAANWKSTLGYCFHGNITETGKGDKGWIGTTASMPTFNSYLTHGWERGAKKISEALDNPSLVIPQAKSVRRRRRRGPMGDSVDIHRVMRGELDTAWDYRKREMSVRKSSKNVLIMLNNSFNANVTAQEAMWSGACAAWLNNILQASGRNVMIEYTSNGFGAITSGGKGSVCFTITVKNYDEPIALDKLAAVASLPGFERIYGFKAILAHDEEICSSLGRGCDWYVPSHVKEYADEVLYISGIRSEQAAVAFLNRTIAQLEGNDG